MQELTGEVANSNPSVQEKLKNYKSVYQEYEKAKGGYLPTLDFYAGIGHEWVNNSNSGWENKDSDVSQARLVLREDIFKGFGTQNDIKKSQAKLESAKNQYFDQINRISFETSQQYLTVLRNQVVYDNSNEIIKRQKEYLNIIKDRVDSGVDLASDLERANAKLANLEADNIMKENDYKESLIKLGKLLGRYIDGRELVKPDFDDSLVPVSLQAGMDNMKITNPMLASVHNDIDYQKFNKKQSEKEYYPYIYAELSHDLNNDMGGVDGFERETRAMLMLQYNLFNGIKDKREVQKNTSLIFKAVDTKNRVARDLANDYQLTWSAHNMLGRQVEFLNRNKNALYKVLKTYKNEYKLGKRKIVDIIDLENEIFSVDTKILAANYEILTLKFKILYTLGVLPEALRIATPIKYGDTEQPEMLDKLPVSMDMDEDKINDATDFCQTSKGNEVASGCDAKTTDAFLTHPFQEPKAEMQSFTVSAPEELQNRKLEKNTIMTTGIQFFEKNSEELSQDAVLLSREIVTQLRKLSNNNTIEIKVYSADNGSEDVDYILSSKRAYNFYRILIKNNISQSAVISFGKSYPADKKDMPMNYITISVKDSAEVSDGVYDIFTNSDISFRGKGLEKTSETGSPDAAFMGTLSQYALMSKKSGDNVALDVVNFSYDKKSAVANKEASDKRAEIIAGKLKEIGMGNVKITSFGIDYELGDDIVDSAMSLKNRTYLIMHTR
ncbi:MAG: TolC family protein [Deferribacterales bacterium]